MKDKVPDELEAGRIVVGSYASTDRDGFNGQFTILGPYGLDLFLQISNGGGWEHLSVHVEVPNLVKPRLPTWIEMNFLKELVWKDTETVVQYHPDKKHYVNAHPYVLHLWRPTWEKIPMPPMKFV